MFVILFFHNTRTCFEYACDKHWPKFILASVVKRARPACRNETSTVNSGAPARAKRAWDRAPYPWNMVNLFSFGCHMIDRAYVRVYRLYGWGRGDYQKEGRGVSGVS